MSACTSRWMRDMVNSFTSDGLYEEDCRDDEDTLVIVAPTLEAEPSSSLQSSSYSPSLVKEFTMSRIQRDVHALIAASGLNISPYAAVKLTSKLSLYNHGYIHIECSSHNLADQVFSILHGQRIADQNVVLAWALTKPHASAQSTAATGRASSLAAQLPIASGHFDNSAHEQVMQLGAPSATAATAATASTAPELDPASFLIDSPLDHEPNAHVDTI
jgi:hypothetical protein